MDAINKLKNKQTLKRLGFALVAVLLIAGIFFYLKTINRVVIDDSLISASVVTISPSSSGVLKSVLVSEGQTIRKGQDLAVVGSETLHAYTDGLIIQTDQAIGGTVSPLTPVVQMINLSDMRVDGTIDENKGLDQIRVGQPVAFTVDALPGQTFWGYVDEVSPTAKQTQLSFSISTERPTQQFDVYAHFDAASFPQIKNGMSAKMVIYTSQN